MTSKKNKLNIIKGASRPFEAEGYLEVESSSTAGETVKKLYLEPTTSKWQ